MSLPPCCKWRPAGDVFADVWTSWIHSAVYLFSLCVICRSVLSINTTFCLSLIASFPPSVMLSQPPHGVCVYLVGQLDRPMGCLFQLKLTGPYHGLITSAENRFLLLIWGQTAESGAALHCWVNGTCQSMFCLINVVESGFTWFAQSLGGRDSRNVKLLTSDQNN